VDSGFAGKTEQVGRLAENLKAIAVAPADVDTIVMTHMHPDHESGLTDSSGKALFPKAELVLHENEFAFWKDEGAMARATPEGQGDFHLARAAFGAYGDRVRTVKTDQVAPGVRAFPTPGHTPGHTAWLIESNGEGLLIWGDIVHFPGIQFAFPDTSVAYDIDLAAAVESRKTVLKFAAGEKLRVAGVHLDFPTFGHVVSNGAAYRFVPEVWRPTI
jgi:glyoxylase-like metal-dependent hydrolase (beta-lactamase superfamily II)